MEIMIFQSISSNAMNSKKYEIKCIDMEVETPIRISIDEFENHWDYATYIVSDSVIDELYFYISSVVDAYKTEPDIRMVIRPLNSEDSTLYIGYTFIQFQDKTICQDSITRLSYEKYKIL